tara:strand:- start:632 stop:1054 length:423 start_codon:yes stop_codon:yes gene_type:complete
MCVIYLLALILNLSIMQTNKELVIEFGKTWNNLDSSFIRDLLIQDFHYASQWVFSEIENKKDYLQYLDSKLSAIAESGGNLVAELGVLNNNYYLVLNQVEDDNDNKTTFLINTKNGKITRADMCLVPAPESITMLGITPK